MSMRFLIIICLSVFLFSSCGDCDENVKVAIIGGGLMGSSTAWHLSNNNQMVLLIEQQDSVYSSGNLLKEIAPYFSQLINPQRVFLAFLKIRSDAYHSLTDKQRRY